MPYGVTEIVYAIQRAGMTADQQAGTDPEALNDRPHVRYGLGHPWWWFGGQTHKVRGIS